MKKSWLIPLLGAIILIGSLYVVYATLTRPPGKGRTIGVLPEKFRFLRPGQTSQDVLDRLGQPTARRSNPRYEVKTPEEWDKIARESDESKGPNAVPTKAALKAAAHLEHRIKDVWSYDTGNGAVVLSFDGTEHLIRWDSISSYGQWSKS